MQEVGGSSPPVPTSLRGTVASLAATAGKPRRLSTEAASIASVQRRWTSSFSMSQVTVTLPDGSQRSVPSGTPVREFASGVLPQSVMKKALAAEVNGQMVDLTFPLDRDASLKIVTPDGAGSAGAVPALDRASAGGRGHPAVPGRPVRHRSGDRRWVLLRLRRQPAVRAGGSREDRSQDARAGEPGPAVRAADVAARGSDRVLPASAASRSRCS